jgi:hypothetical protein
MGNKNYSKGITWINDCRIPFVDGDTTSAGKRTCNIFETEYKSGGNGSPDYITDSRGRFPANILVSDDMLNDGSMSKAGEYKGNGSKSGGIWSKSTGKPAGVEYGDKGSNSRYYDIDKWFNNLIDG